MRRLLVALLPIALVVAACGSNDDDGSNVRGSSSASGSGSASASASGSASGPAEAPVALPGKVNDKGTGEVKDGKLDVELDDFYFRPTFIRAEPGEKVTLTLHNRSDRAHTFTAGAVGVDTEVGPGDTATVALSLPARGAIAFACRFHRSQGMRGALYSRAGDKVAGGG